MRGRPLWRALAALVPVLSFISPAQAGTVAVTPDFGGSASITVRSILELKYRTVVRQQHDFSCGSAAVATLLTYHYETPVKEQDVLLPMYEKGNRAAILREGFSLLDMKQYLDARGFQSDGIYAGLDDLARVGVPAIVLIEDNGYKHFVVIKGVSKTEVLIGDPAAGLRLYKRTDFEKLWTNRLLFVVRSRANIAKNHFNTPQQWAAMLRAPLGDAVARESLSNITLLRPSGIDF